MAPLASDPQQVLLVLNLAKRKALYQVIDDITRWMRSQVELSVNAEGVTPLHLALRNEGLAHFDAWRRELLAKLKELLSAPDDAKVVEERRKRTERMARERVESPAAGENLIDFSDPSSGMGSGRDVATRKAERAAAVTRLQALYHPVPTRLTTIPLRDREETLSCVLLLLLSTGKYSAESRTLLVYLSSTLELPLEILDTEEVEVATALAAANTDNRHGMSADVEAEKRKQDGQTGRYWKVGLASVAGAALIGVTGGLAAPVVAGAIGGIMGSVGLGGVASFLGIFWMNGALVGTLFGAFGAKMTGEAVDQYAKEVDDFKFIPLKEHRQRKNEKHKLQGRRLRVTIGVNGWLTSEDDITKPWQFVGRDSEAFALRYEMKALLGLGVSLEEMVTSYAWKFVRLEILKRTVLATLWSALWPVTLLSMASKIDNPFTLAKNRSEKAGEILADAIINKVQGERPVTLVGYSLGARVVYTCLMSLAKRRAFGLVDTAVFIGAPIPSSHSHWQILRSVVSGKIYNVFSENDYLLAFLYRATSIQLGVAGLQEIAGIEGVQNLNLSEEVQGHLRYPSLMDKILARCNFPMAEGAAVGPIEHDDDEIVLQNGDSGKTGTLIELDVLSPDGPSSHPVSQSVRPQTSLEQPPQRASPVQTKERATVIRAATSRCHGPLSTGEPISTLEPLPPYRSQSFVLSALSSREMLSFPLHTATSALAQDPDQCKSLSTERPDLKYSGTAREMVLRTKSISQSQLHTSGQGTSRNIPPTIASMGGTHSDDSDDDEGFAIKMIDNDTDVDDIGYLDPVPIEE